MNQLTRLFNDRSVRSGEYRGYEYCIRRTPIGTVCCYINAQGNAFVRSAFRHDVWTHEHIDRIFPMHGGVTYFTRGLFSMPDWKDDIVVGCDYGHYGDTMTGLSETDLDRIAESLISEDQAEKELKIVIDHAADFFDL